MVSRRKAKRGEQTQTCKPCDKSRKIAISMVGYNDRLARIQKQHPVNIEPLTGNNETTIQPSRNTVNRQNMKTKENKIYRVQLVLDDEIAISKDDKVTVYATENEQDAKRVFEKLSENKNLKYVLK